MMNRRVVGRMAARVRAWSAGHENDGGAASLLDLLMGAVITAILMSGLAAVMLSAQQAASSAEARSQAGEQIADATAQIRTALGGSSAAGRCLVRDAPTDPGSLDNCRRVGDGEAILTAGEPNRVCVLVRGSLARGDQPDPIAILLGSFDQVCIEVTEDGRLGLLRTPAGSDADFVVVDVNGDETSTLALVVDVVPADAARALLSYFDAHGVELSPGGGDQPALDADQRAEVRTVRLAASVERTRAVQPLEMEIALGAGVFAQERRWQGR